MEKETVKKVNKKVDYKKDEKEIYGIKNKPVIVTIPKQKYFCIKGVGNPNGEDFAQRLQVLYALSYHVKMKLKQVEGYYEYTVYPLEGVWGLTEMGIKEQGETGKLNKDELSYTIMIRQPEFLTPELAKQTLDFVQKSKKNPLIDEAYYDVIDDGLCVQMLHLGSYDSETESFNQMKAFIKEKGVYQRYFEHREIYLSDARKVAPEKLKTILRYFIK